MDEQEKRAVRGLVLRALFAGVLGMVAGVGSVKLMELAGARSFDSYAPIVWVPWIVVVVLFLPMAYRMGRDAARSSD